MENKSVDNYNQGVAKYKVLSSNAGAGAIVTTKAGFFVMPESVSEWGFINHANRILAETYNAGREVSSVELARDAGVDVIDDNRFVAFLRNDQQLNRLKYLIDVPHLALDKDNKPNCSENPLSRRYQASHPGASLTAEHFVIPAIHFPRWFYSRRTKNFQPLDVWRDLWREKGQDLRCYAPPRDPEGIIDRNSSELLVQIPLLLICKNGHISDVPWYQLFCAGIDGQREEMKSLDGFDLFGYRCNDCNCGGLHEIQFLENRSNPESWGVLKCRRCGKTYSLEGVMNIRPFCPGETPWNGIGTQDKGECRDVTTGHRCAMQMVLATSNSVYYADSFSSLYIPQEYLEDAALPTNLQRVLDLLETRWYPRAQTRNPELTKDEYSRAVDVKDKADESGIEITENDAEQVKTRFLREPEAQDNDYESYRYDEYKVFSERSGSMADVRGLDFGDIDLPEDLRPYFRKIQKVDTLTMTLTQLGFYRVSVPELELRQGHLVPPSHKQRIYRNADDVYALPAYRSYGEGLFFEFNVDAVQGWMRCHEQKFARRYGQRECEIGKDLKAEMELYGAAKFYLLHTFAHAIIKELEFSCGYPAASLKERLYYSDRMCGVLIYTVDGAEGSMGGLVWQGQPRLISKIIKSAMDNARECSSDPICWENEEQLNLAACFSCCLISETSCEKRNLGLDRRALIDDDFGFFKDLRP